MTKLVAARSSLTLGLFTLLLVGLWLGGCDFNSERYDKVDCSGDPTRCPAGTICAPEGVCVIDTDVPLVDPDVPDLCGGTTRCLETQACCAGACVDLAIDPQHCGVCDAPCGAGMECSEGACACQPERDDCNGDPADGCEVDLSADDAMHCGACGRTCGPNMVCVFGSCVCTSGLLDCNQDIATDGCEADILTDQRNCGGCSDDDAEPPADFACVAPEQCSAGRCQCGSEPCALGEECCGDACVDTSRSASHCGACGQACQIGEVCNDGVCECNFGIPPLDQTETCGAGERCCSTGCVSSDTCLCGLSACTVDQACCNDTCTALDTEMNCAACGVVCRNDESCQNGACRCGAGKTFCEQAGTCVDLLSEEAHCGGCGLACGAGQSCCNGACVATDDDPTQCGGCLAEGGTACASDQGCCDGACRSLSSPTSCGSCANDCTDLPRVSTATCTGSTCGISTCDQGFRDCNGMAADGCERNTRDDEAHCGACGNACGAGESCTDGVCTCGGEQCMGGTVCQNGACTCGGVACGDGALCINNECRCGNASGEACGDPAEGDHCEGNLCRCGGGGSCHQSSKVCSSGSCING